MCMLIKSIVYTHILSHAICPFVSLSLPLPLSPCLSFSLSLSLSHSLSLSLSPSLSLSLSHSLSLPPSTSMHTCRQKPRENDGFMLCFVVCVCARSNVV